MELDGKGAPLNRQLRQDSVPSRVALRQAASMPSQLFGTASLMSPGLEVTLSSPDKTSSLCRSSCPVCVSLGVRGRLFAHGLAFFRSVEEEKRR